MIPILFQIGNLKIYTFGVFLVLALYWALFLSWKNIKLTSYKEEDIFDSFFISLFGVLFFARLFYVLLNFSDFGFDFGKFVLINGYPGLSLFGGVFGGLFTFYLYSLNKKFEFKYIADYFMGPLFLGLAIGKIGSFFAGIDIGLKTSFMLSTKMIGFSGSRHIVSLYEAILFFFFMYFCQKILMNVRKNKFKSGFVLFFMIWSFSLVNLLLDNIKQNHLYFFGFSFNLLISVILFICLSIYFLIYFRKEIALSFNNLIISIKKYGKKSN